MFVWTPGGSEAINGLAFSSTLFSEHFMSYQHKADIRDRIQCALRGEAEPLVASFDTHATGFGKILVTPLPTRVHRFIKVRIAFCDLGCILVRIIVRVRDVWMK